VSGVAAPRIVAVTLRRRDARGASRVAHVLSGPNVASARGILALNQANREALLNGQLVITAITTGAPHAESRLILPGASTREPAGGR
jgi:hypothetical protein